MPDGIFPGSGPGVMPTEPPKVPWMQKAGVKGMGVGLFATWLLQKILQTGHETGMRNIQREGLRSQAEMITPENLYMQAAQPQAQEEESMARQALFSQLSGGVLGPSLAKGEYMIGGS